jgi:glycopeptide antibiotics resistance protein
MDAMRTNFAVSIMAATVVVVVTGVGMVAAWQQTPRPDAAAVRRRVAAVALTGAVALVLATTALPLSWPPVWEGWGDVVLKIGRGGLASWRDLASPFEHVATVQLWANVVVYVPLGAALLVATGSTRRTLAYAALLSLLVEVWQFTALSRVASVDDVLLNLTGTLLGIVPTKLVTSKSSDALH